MARIWGRKNDKGIDKGFGGWLDIGLASCGWNWENHCILMPPTSRRAFLGRSAAFAVSASLLNLPRPAEGATASHSKSQAVRLGGPIFANAADPEELALAHRKLGYRAAYCPNISLKETDKIQAFSTAFSKHDVMIAEVGRWVNLMDSDQEKRRKNLETVTDGLALAEAVGARCCVDIAGSFSPTSWFGPHKDNFSREFFDAAVENARKIVDAVKPKRTSFCYEVMGWAWPATTDHYLKLIKAVDRKAFAVHLDPCNMVNSPEKFYNNTALLDECFDKLGRWIVSCHAKDLTWDVEMNIHFREVAPGKGSIDYATYLKRLALLPQNPPLMLEHLSAAAEYDGAREYIFGVGHKADLSFGS
jgi:sugar phosphate isomerase/epimerase